MIEAIEKKGCTLPIFVAACVVCLCIGFGIAWFVKPDMASQMLRLEAMQNTKCPITQQTKSPQMVENIVPHEIVNEVKPRWQRHAKPIVLKEGYSYVAIVLDDIGVVPDRSRMAVENLPAEISLAFLPYGSATSKLVPEAYARGHEVIVHMPMEPHRHTNGYQADPGPDALFTHLSADDIRQRTQKNIDSMKQYAVGVNNHMGSAFTAWEEGMRTVLDVVAQEELFFMDSLTSPNSVVKQAASEFKMPLLVRHVFLDHVKNEQEILNYLDKTVRVAKARGKAIAIGHPHAETLSALDKWLPTLEENKIQLIPITAMIDERP